MCLVVIGTQFHPHPRHSLWAFSLDPCQEIQERLTGIGVFVAARAVVGGWEPLEKIGTWRNWERGRRRSCWVMTKNTILENFGWGWKTRARKKICYIHPRLSKMSQLCLESSFRSALTLASQSVLWAQSTTEDYTRAKLCTERNLPRHESKQNIQTRTKYHKGRYTSSSFEIGIYFAWVACKINERLEQMSWLQGESASYQVSLSTGSVSYTHLTLPTRRTV